MGVKSAFFAQTFLPVKIFLPAQSGKSFLPVNRFTGNEIGSLSFVQRKLTIQAGWPYIQAHFLHWKMDANDQTLNDRYIKKLAKKFFDLALWFPPLTAI